MNSIWALSACLFTTACEPTIVNKISMNDLNKFCSCFKYEQKLKMGVAGCVEVGSLIVADLPPR